MPSKKLLPPPISGLLLQPKAKCCGCASLNSTRSGVGTWSRSRTNTPRRRGSPCGMCGVTVLTCSRGSKRITRSAKTTASGRPSKCRRRRMKRSPRSTRCWRPRKGKSSRCEVVGARDGEDRAVAIIMDGNGRWAAARGLPRGEGHRRGVEALRRTVRAAADLGIDFLTIFSFSAENWSRPRAEIRELMGLLRRFVRHDLADLHRRGVRVRVIGEREGLDPDIRRLLDEAEELTKDNNRLVLVVAFNYGARQEIARAARRMAAAVAAGKLAVSAVTADSLASYLDLPDLPDPDLIISTSGEQRLSNFLLWQAAYSELVFVPTYWPDFDRAALESAIAEYRRRERRFGGLAVRTGS